MITKNQKTKSNLHKKEASIKAKLRIAVHIFTSSTLFREADKNRSPANSVESPVKHDGSQVEDLTSYLIIYAVYKRTKYLENYPIGYFRQTYQIFFAVYKHPVRGTRNNTSSKNTNYVNRQGIDRQLWSIVRLNICSFIWVGACQSRITMTLSTVSELLMVIAKYQN